MFTSRAEYRLLLREDNADLRLTEIARELGLVDDYRWRAFNVKKEAIVQQEQRLKTTWVQPGSDAADTLAPKLKSPLAREYNLYDLLKRPELSFSDLPRLGDVDVTVETQVAEQVEISAKYAGYIDRQTEEIARLRNHEATPLPADMDYGRVSGLSNEIKQKLTELRPDNLGRAARISGVTPAAISLLLVYLKKQGMLKKSSAAISGKVQLG